MKRLIVLAAGLFLSGAVAGAAEIHGTITRNGKPLAATAVKLECGSASVSGQTDEFGAYSLKIGTTGECKFSLEAKGASSSLAITVYEKPSRYDLVLAEEGGKPVLRRR